MGSTSITTSARDAENLFLIPPPFVSLTREPRGRGQGADQEAQGLRHLQGHGADAEDSVGQGHRRAAALRNQACRHIGTPTPQPGPHQPPTARSRAAPPDRTAIVRPRTHACLVTLRLSNKKKHAPQTPRSAPHEPPQAEQGGAARPRAPRRRGPRPARHPPEARRPHGREGARRPARSPTRRRGGRVAGGGVAEANPLFPPLASHTAPRQRGRAAERLLTPSSLARDAGARRCHCQRAAEPRPGPRAPGGGPRLRRPRHAAAPRRLPRAREERAAPPRALPPHGARPLSFQRPPTCFVLSTHPPKPPRRNTPRLAPAAPGAGARP